ncbi:MAG: tripartite tricarboxylate transporter substrate binding protein [Betaproteobacteria bacterium]|nr:tripartite tricarboxylate transporter substrate binding protein [Betaproteobacteria bacterium]
MRRALLTIFLAFLSASVLAQSYPSRPVRIVVAFPPGGSADVLGRLMAVKLSELWTQPVVIENKPGASANIGADHVAKSPPDGYTLLLATPALAVSAAAFSNLTYDAQRDLAPVAMVSVFANVLVVHPSVPAATPQELIRYAKANPGKLSYASAGSTSAIRFAFEHFKQITGIDAVHIPYKGSAPSTQAMISGESHTMMMTLVDALPHIKNGRLRALAATTASRIAVLPELPTLSETAAPGFDYITWHGFFAPAGTPAAVIEKINRDVNSVLGQADVKERLTTMGMDIRPGTPADLGSLFREEISKWKEVARVANIKAE